jgi:pyruvate/2-oxoglutarate dehydrogenase complex dihydrolipoamide dehydrogenase (E3) component
VGGGYIGIELSQAMRRFGSSVTVIERNEALCIKRMTTLPRASARCSKMKAST